MIDTAVILFSTIVCLIVVIRSVRLDRSMPWHADPREGEGGGFAPEPPLGAAPPDPHEFQGYPSGVQERRAWSAPPSR